MSEHVDGEDEGTRELLAQAKAQFTTFARMHRPMPVWLITLFSWLARESFRAGYRRAHQKPTVLPRQPVTEFADFDITFDDDVTPTVPYPKE